MEDEIKVNEYARIRGEILQIDVITNITEKDCYIKFKEYASGNTFNFSEIKEWKHSPNLIDLIQCGDYVNGEKVEKIAEPSLANDYNRLIYCNECEGLYKLILFNKDIKEIVTKEMMEFISYKVTKM